MAEQEGSGEKSYDPTPKKLEDARKKGNIPKSNELTGAAVYVGLLLAGFAAGPQIISDVGATLMQFLDQPDRLTGHLLGPGGSGLAGDILSSLAFALAPLVVLPFVAACGALLAQNAVAVSFDKVNPRVSRISFIENAKNKFGPTGLMEFAKSAIKLITISVTAFLLLAVEIETVIGASRASPAALSQVMMTLFMKFLIGVTIISAFIALIDTVWQRFDHQRKLRMSFQDIKDENKESEGDPHMKQKRRQRAQEIASNQMMIDVPKADVIVVNPTHYAVALKWDRAGKSAPICVAKGTDEIAMRIREIASEASVPIHRDAPTARALHAVVEIGHEIPPDHYRAVAAAIRFADEMRHKAKERGWDA